jgi:hypothetical protein
MNRPDALRQTRRRFSIASKPRSAFSSPLITALTALTASVWLLFGLGFKVLGLLPRHRLIVAAMFGDAAAGPITVIIGAGETALALWILSGFSPRFCAAVQTAAIGVMNTLEIRFAKNLLLSPILMVVANTGFLIAVWYRAIKLAKLRS